MRWASLAAALLILAPIAATPAVGSNHEETLPDRDFVLLMRGTGFNGFTYPDTPLLEAFVGETVRFTVVVPPLVGEPHTFHLHGHPWLVEDGRIIDTVLLDAGGTHQFNVVAGSVGKHAGDWMYHCHIDDHTRLGMWGVFRVYPFATRLLVAGPTVEVSLDRLGAPVEASELRLTLDGAPVDAHVVPQGDGRYTLHASLPEAATGALVVTAQSAEWGESVARATLGGAQVAPPSVTLDAALAGGAPHGH